LRISGRTELKARVKIRQPKELEAEELEVFNSLRLSVVVLVELAAKAITEVIAVEVASELIAELNAELDAELIAELKARVKIRQPKKLEVFDSLRLSIVLLIAVRY